MRKKLDTKDFCPKILKCIYFEGSSFPKGTRFDNRTLSSYEIEIFTYSDGGFMETNGGNYPIDQGCITFRRPGEVVRGIATYSCYSICFDLGNTSKTFETFNISKPQELDENYENEVLDAIPTIFAPSSFDSYRYLADLLLKEVVTRNAAIDVIAKSVILHMIYKMYVDSQSLKVNIAHTAHYVKMNKAIDFINEHFHENISVDQLASEVKMSPNYFHKVFVEATGQTPNKVIVGLKLDKAKQLLATTNLNIGEIAEQCGFGSDVYFNYVFKKNTDQTPKNYRKKYTILFG